MDSSFPFLGGGVRLRCPVGQVNLANPCTRRKSYRVTRSPAAVFVFFVENSTREGVNFPLS